jgi:hypothetical protein
MLATAGGGLRAAPHDGADPEELAAMAAGAVQHADGGRHRGGPHLTCCPRARQEGRW